MTVVEKYKFEIDSFLVVVYVSDLLIIEMFNTWDIYP